MLLTTQCKALGRATAYGTGTGSLLRVESVVLTVVYCITVDPDALRSTTYLPSHQSTYTYRASDLLQISRASCWPADALPREVLSINPNVVIWSESLLLFLLIGLRHTESLVFGSQCSPSLNASHSCEFLPPTSTSRSFRLTPPTRATDHQPNYLD